MRGCAGDPPSGEQAGSTHPTQAAMGLGVEARGLVLMGVPDAPEDVALLMAAVAVLCVFLSPTEFSLRLPGSPPPRLSAAFHVGHWKPVWMQAQDWCRGREAWGQLGPRRGSGPRRKAMQGHPG